jgi:hypothetical protein
MVLKSQRTQVRQKLKAVGEPTEWKTSSVDVETRISEGSSLINNRLGDRFIASLIAS